MSYDGWSFWDDYDERNSKPSKRKKGHHERNKDPLVRRGACS